MGRRLGVPYQYMGNFMSIKLIASDLDGTLLSPDHLTVSERTVKALREAHEKGIKIAIATGRTLSMIYDVIDQLPFADYVIYSNGAAAYDLRKARVVYSHPLPQSIAADIVDYLDCREVYYEVYAGGKQYSQQSKQQYCTNLNLPQEFLEDYIRKLYFVDNLAEFAKENVCEKVNVYYFGNPRLNEIREHFEACPDVLFTSPVAGDIEITHTGVDKVQAIDAICAELGITRGEVMAFGDADNDLGMIKAAGYGFAMENGAELCKREAEYIARSNEVDGVARAVERYALGKKPRLLVSACLLGENCKYNGGNNKNPAVIALSRDFELIPVCPECFGGLPIPRVPNEIIGGRAISKNGEDFTAEYNSGAEKTLYIANEKNVRLALLKERSPSCGKGGIYDGSFTGKLVEGNGITADLLIKRGISVFGESEIDNLLDEADL